MNFFLYHEHLILIHEMQSYFLYKLVGHGQSYPSDPCLDSYHYQHLEISEVHWTGGYMTLMV